MEIIGFEIRDVFRILNIDFVKYYWNGMLYLNFIDIIVVNCNIIIVISKEFESFDWFSYYSILVSNYIMFLYYDF